MGETNLEDVWVEGRRTCMFCKYARNWYLTVGSGLRVQGRCEFGVQISIGYVCDQFVRNLKEPRISMSIPALLEIRRRLERRVLLERRIEKVKRELEEVLE